MLAAFISTNTSGIPPTKADPISRTFPSLFTINLPEEDQIVHDLEDIKGWVCGVLVRDVVGGG